LIRDRVSFAAQHIIVIPAKAGMTMMGDPARKAAGHRIKSGVTKKN
jgi:hypothetical protein